MGGVVISKEIRLAVIGILFLLLGFVGVYALMASVVDAEPDLTEIIRQEIRDELQHQLEPYRDTNERMSRWLDEWEILTQEEWEESEESRWK